MTLVHWLMTGKALAVVAEALNKPLVLGKLDWIKFSGMSLAELEVFKAWGNIMRLLEGNGTKVLRY